MISTSDGTGVAQTWLPRKVAEQFLESAKDGPIKLSPDPVTMISGDLSWYNHDSDRQNIVVTLHRSARTIVAQSPATVIITDATSSRIGVDPQADFPSVIADTFGGRLQIDRASAAAADLQYARYILEGDDSTLYVPVGIVPPGQAFHFRYLAAVQTPNVWTEPTEFTPKWEANARWTRLVALASPAL